MGKPGGVSVVAAVGFVWCVWQRVEWCHLVGDGSPGCCCCWWSLLLPAVHVAFELAAGCFRSKSSPLWRAVARRRRLGCNLSPDFCGAGAIDEHAGSMPAPPLLARYQWDKQVWRCHCVRASRLDRSNARPSSRACTAPEAAQRGRASERGWESARKVSLALPAALPRPPRARLPTRRPSGRLLAGPRSAARGCSPRRVPPPADGAQLERGLRLRPAAAAAAARVPRRHLGALVECQLAHGLLVARAACLTRPPPPPPRRRPSADPRAPPPRRPPPARHLRPRARRREADAVLAAAAAAERARRDRGASTDGVAPLRWPSCCRTSFRWAPIAGVRQRAVGLMRVDSLRLSGGTAPPSPAAGPGAPPPPDAAAPPGAAGAAEGFLGRLQRAEFNDEARLSYRLSRRQGRWPELGPQGGGAGGAAAPAARQRAAAQHEHAQLERCRRRGGHAAAAAAGAGGASAAAGAGAARRRGGRGAGAVARHAGVAPPRRRHSLPG